MKILNNLVSGYFDFAEIQVIRHNPIIYYYAYKKITIFSHISRFTIITNSIERKKKKMKNEKRESHGCGYGYGCGFFLIMELGETDPLKHIAAMFEKTDDSGDLFVLDTNDCGRSPRLYLRCKMNWTEADRDRMIDEYEALYPSLVKLGELYKRLVIEEDCKDLLTPELYEVWNRFVKPFDVGRFDYERIFDISCRMDAVEEVGILKTRALNVELTENEKAYINEFGSEVISDDDAEYYNEYRSHLKAQAVERVGGNVGAFGVVKSAQRVCRLLSLNAPEFIVRIEKLHLAQSMAIHAFAETPLTTLILCDA